MMPIEVEILKVDNWVKCNKFRLTKPLHFNGIIVPKGFICDGATISRWLTLIGLIIMIVSVIINITLVSIIGIILTLIPVIFPRISNYFKATIVHDYCIKSNIMPRRDSDLLFLSNLEHLGVSKVRRLSMYITVSMYTIIKGLMRG